MCARARERERERDRQTDKQTDKQTDSQNFVKRRLTDKLKYNDEKQAISALCGFCSLTLCTSAVLNNIR